MPRRLILLFAVILGLLLAPRPSWGQQILRPPLDAKTIEPLLRTDWFGLYLQGKKIGYFRSTRARDGDQIRESTTLSMKLASFGQKTEVLNNQTMTFEAKAPYRLLRGEMEQQSAPTPVQKTVLVRGNQGFDVTFQTGNVVSKKQLPDADYTLVDAVAPDVWIRLGPPEGDKATFKTFDMMDTKAYTMTSKVLSIKKAIASGVPVRYFEVENESSKERLKFLTRHDDQGRTLSSTIAIFELRMEPEELAKNTEFSQDLFVLGMVKSDKKLGPTKKVAELVIQVDGKEGEIFEDGPRQSVAAGPGGSKLVRLGKKHGKETAATKKEIEENLAETNTYCISHPRVKALAEKAIGNATTPEEKIKRIVDFAADYVKPSLSASIPSIHDLMDRKQGDCKSYALLVTNLARAAGVPAREVSGLLYIGDDQKAFGGHAWNEVVLGGVWVPVDASLRQTEVDATHISFGTEYTAARTLLTTLGKLSVKVVEVKSAP